LFHKGSQNKQNVSFLPGHPYQWDKIIIHVAQMQFYLSVLLGEYVSQAGGNDSDFYMSGALFEYQLWHRLP
jgi:hypothetical protein